MKTILRAFANIKFNDNKIVEIESDRCLAYPLYIDKDRWLIEFLQNKKMFLWDYRGRSRKTQCKNKLSIFFCNPLRAHGIDRDVHNFSSSNVKCARFHICYLLFCEPMSFHVIHFISLRFFSMFFLCSCRWVELVMTSDILWSQILSIRYVLIFDNMHSSAC